MKKTQMLNPAVRYKLDQVDDRFVPIEAGWKYTVGDYTLEMISCRGIRRAMRCSGQRNRASCSRAIISCLIYRRILLPGWNRRIH